jgi:multimeric flavodoxin WrbA
LKVLGIFGSPRRGGNTEILLEEALKGAEKEGAEVERLHLTDFAITPCKECHGCDKTGNCVILDDMQKIYPKLLEADVIILASPIFFYGLTAWASIFSKIHPWERKVRRERGFSFLWEAQKDRGSLRGRPSPPNIFSMSSMRNTLAN